MEGSSSANKRGGDGLPPIAPRSNRRRMREENLNEEGAEIAAAEAEPNLQPQPQQVGGSGEMELAAVDQRSRLANRRYSEAFRTRRQNHVQQLLIRLANLEAEIAHKTGRIHSEMVQSSVLQSENVALKEQHDASATHLLSREVETEKLRAEIEALKRMDEAERQEIVNTMTNNPNYLHLHEAYRNTLGAALGPFFPSESMNYPTGDVAGLTGPLAQNPPNPDQAGPSGDNDSDDSS